MTIFENGIYRVMYAGHVTVSGIVRQRRTAFCNITTSDGREFRAEIRRSLNMRDEICHFTGRDGLCYIVSSSNREKG